MLGGEGWSRPGVFLGTVERSDLNTDRGHQQLFQVMEYDCWNLYNDVQLIDSDFLLSFDFYFSK